MTFQVGSRRPDSPISRTALSIGLLTIISSVGAAVAVAMNHVSVSPEAILAFTTIITALFPLVRRLLQSSFHLFEPIVGASVMMAILFGLRPISTLMTGSFIYHHAQSIEPQFAQTVVLGLTGTAAFVIAYEICTPIRTSGPVDRENRSAHLDMSSIYAYAAVISAVGIALFAAQLSLAGGVLKTLRLMAAGRSQQLGDSFANSSEYLSSAPVLLACAAIVLVVATRGHLSATARIFVFAAAAVSALPFFLLGDRRYMVPCLAIPVVAYYLARQRQPSRKLVLIVVPIAFVLLSTIPYQRVSGGREQGGGAIPIFREGLARPVDSWKRFITGSDTEVFSALAVEVGILSKPSDFAYGKATLGDLALAPIPSAVFPGKPTTARNQMLTKAFGTPCQGFGGLCPDFSAIGTFYQDLSYLGVVVGMAALGAASGLIWRRYRRDPTGPFSVLLAATWTVHLPILIRAGFMPPFAWFLYFLLPPLLGLGIATSRGPRVRVPSVATLAASGGQGGRMNWGGRTAVDLEALAPSATSGEENAL